MTLPIFKRHKTIEELEEEKEQLDAENQVLDSELTKAQKQDAIRRLKEAGLSKKHFPSWDSIKNWLKTH